MRGSTPEEFDRFLANREPIRERTAFAEGDCVGEWRLTAFLAKGGAGEVYRAERVRDRKPAAVKVYVPRSGRSEAQEAAARQRFVREARILAENTYPFFPRFYGRGEVRGIPYFAMELLEDCALPSSDGGVAAFLLRVSAAVSVLHVHGLVHRDIKPQNILRRANGELVLIDLGLVKEFTPGLAATGLSVTLVDGKVAGAGTPRYAAPEQFNGGAISPATDIHALGRLANECFGGNPPRVWDRIIERSTSSIPERRYRDVDAFTRAIRHRHYARQTAWCGLALVIFGLIAVLPGVMRNHFMARSQSTARSSSFIPRDGVATAVETIEELRTRLASAKAGTVIWVKPGRYEGSLVVMTNDLKILAVEADPRKTVIVGEKLKSVIQVGKGCDGLVVRGFTLTGGTGTALVTDHSIDYYGGGIYTKSSITVEDCIIRNNGKGEVRKDAATFGGGAWVAAAAVLRLVNCLVADNFAWACGGAIGAGDGASEVELERCTVADNQAATFFGRQGGVGLAESGRCFIRDSILWGNAGDQIGAFAGPYSRKTVATVENCVIEGGAKAGAIRAFEASGCMMGNPEFADREMYLPKSATAFDIGFRVPGN